MTENTSSDRSLPRPGRDGTAGVPPKVPPRTLPPVSPSGAAAQLPENLNDLFVLPPDLIAKLQEAHSRTEAFVAFVDRHIASQRHLAAAAKELSSWSSGLCEEAELLGSVLTKDVVTNLAPVVANLETASRNLSSQYLDLSTQIETLLTAPLREYSEDVRRKSAEAKSNFDRALREYESAVVNYCSKKTRGIDPSSGSFNTETVRPPDLVEDVAHNVYSTRQTLCAATLEYISTARRILSVKELHVIEKLEDVASTVSMFLSRVVPVAKEADQVSHVLHIQTAALRKALNERTQPDAGTSGTTESHQEVIVARALISDGQALGVLPDHARKPPAVSPRFASGMTAITTGLNGASPWEFDGFFTDSTGLLSLPRTSLQGLPFGTSLPVNDSLKRKDAVGPSQPENGVSSLGPVPVSGMTQESIRGGTLSFTGDGNSSGVSWENSTPCPGKTSTAMQNIATGLMATPPLHWGLPDPKQRQGYLFVKQQGSKEGWTRQYFYIKEPECLLVLYASEENQEVIADIKASAIQEAMEKERHHVFEVKQPGAVLYFQAETERDMRDWISSLTAAKEGIDCATMVNAYGYPVHQVGKPKSRPHGSADILQQPPPTPKLSQCDVEVVRSGMLLVKDAKAKSGRFHHSWHKTLCTLKANGVFFQYNESDNSLVQVLDMRGQKKSQVQVIDETLFSRKHCFSVTVSTDASRVTYFAAETASRRNDWVSGLRWYSQWEDIAEDWRATTEREADLQAVRKTEDYPEPESTSGCATVANEEASVPQIPPVPKLPALLMDSPSPPFTRPSTRSSSANAPLSATFDHTTSTPMLTNVRLHRSFWLRITDGRNMPVCDPYCEFFFDNDIRARTSTKSRTATPFWREDFFFDDLPPWKSGAAVVVMNHNRIQKDTQIGRIEIPIRTIRRGEDYEGWYPVVSTTAGTGTSPPVIEHCGDIRLKLRYDEEVVLDSSEYQDILKILLNFESGAVYDLANCSTDLERLAENLVHIYEVKEQSVRWIMCLVSKEVAMSDDTNILFRGNSILTKAIDVYMKMVGLEYLDETIGDVIRTICEQKVHCEVDPTRLEKHDNLSNHWRVLMSYTRLVWKKISESAERCPVELRVVFSHLQRVIVEKFSANRYYHVRYTCVSGFLFLRFFCPAVLSPKLFHLVREHPDQRTLRTLTLLGKSLQSLANLATFGVKEPYMGGMNEFLMEATNEFTAYIDRVAVPPDGACHANDHSQQQRPPQPKNNHLPLNPYLLDLDREVARLARFVTSHQAQLRQTGQGGVDLDQLITASEIVNRNATESANSLPGHGFVARRA